MILQICNWDKRDHVFFFARDTFLLQKLEFHQSGKSGTVRELAEAVPIENFLPVKPVNQHCNRKEGSMQSSTGLYL